MNSNTCYSLECKYAWNISSVIDVCPRSGSPPMMVIVTASWNVYAF